jgi:hypothetical protein
MMTVMERGAMTTVGRGGPGATRPSRLPITLADLLTAIQDVVGPEEDGLVVATVLHLLGSGRLTGLGTGTCRCPPNRQENVGLQILKGGVQTSERGCTPVALRPESRWKGRAGNHREPSQSITGKEVKSHGRVPVVCRLGRGAGGAWGAGGGHPTPAR